MMTLFDVVSYGTTSWGKVILVVFRALMKMIGHVVAKIHRFE
jgi:hypothetical protein